MGNSPQTTRFAIFNLERISFSVYIIPESNLVPEREFHSDWKPENDLKRNKILFWYHVSKWWEMQRWNQLVPEWKSFRYHVNSPLSRGTCMASRSMHILMSHFCDTQMGGICHKFFLSLQDALKFTLIKLTITRNSPYSSLDFEACLGFQNIEDAKIACGDMCHPREKWSQHFVIKLNRSTQIYWRRCAQEEMCKAVRKSTTE